jgi:hypothetical protein
MIKKITLILFQIFLLTSCGQAPTEPPAGTPVPSATPILSPTPPPDPATPTPTAVACEDGAVLVEDVTYPDNTLLTAGETFTKTWKLQNTGTCTWAGYTVAFVSGDSLDAPDSVPVPETEAKATVDVSVELSAPAGDGAYTGNFELRDAQGKSIPVGTEPTFWVKIIVGEGADPLGVKQRIGDCAYTENPEYVQTMIDLVNKTRQQAGLEALTINDQLTAAAQAHSLDMACNGAKFLEHKGSDGSWTGERLASVGYTNTYYFELLGVGLAQDALHEWSRHEDQWPAVIDPYAREIGVGYAYSKFSRYGGYWTVIVGAP